MYTPITLFFDGKPETFAPFGRKRIPSVIGEKDPDAGMLLGVLGQNRPSGRKGTYLKRKKGKG